MRSINLRASSSPPGCVISDPILHSGAPARNAEQYLGPDEKAQLEKLVQQFEEGVRDNDRDKRLQAFEGTQRIAMRDLYIRCHSGDQKACPASDAVDKVAAEMGDALRPPAGPVRRYRR